MASKNDLKDELAGAQAARDMLQRDNDVYRARECTRMRIEHNARQAKLETAERKERYTTVSRTSAKVCSR